MRKIFIILLVVFVCSCGITPSKMVLYNSAYVPGDYIGMVSYSFDEKYSVYFYTYYQILYDGEKLIVTDTSRQKIVSSVDLPSKPIDFNVYQYPQYSETSNEFSIFKNDFEKSLGKYSLENPPDLSDVSKRCFFRFFLLLEHKPKNEIYYCEAKFNNLKILKRAFVEGEVINDRYKNNDFLESNKKIINIFISTVSKNTGEIFDYDMNFKEINRQSFGKQIKFDALTELYFDGKNVCDISFNTIYPIKADINKSLFVNTLETSLPQIYDSSTFYDGDKLYFIGYDEKLSIDLPGLTSSSSNILYTTTNGVYAVYIDNTYDNDRIVKNKILSNETYKILYASPFRGADDNDKHFFILGEKIINKDNSIKWSLIGVRTKPGYIFDVVPIDTLEADIKYFFWYYEKDIPQNTNSPTPIAFTDKGVYKLVEVK